MKVALVGRKSETREAVGLLKRMLAITDDHKYLQFPLAVNKQWSAQFEDVSRTGRVGNESAETSVLGVEDVTTTAGTFRAFKIERYEIVGSGTPGGRANRPRRIEHTYYYSPETRSIVKYHRLTPGIGTREIELIKFTPVN
jgi:hypothetical protein